jgi:ribonuclease VapC
LIIFADASALIAMIAGEDDADALANLLETGNDRLCSAIAAWETVAGLRKSHAFSIPAARELVGRFLERFGFRFVEVGEKELRFAVDAYARYGKGRHRAALNMGDCLAYACAKANGARLLYTGEDFRKTDLA